MTDLPRCMLMFMLMLGGCVRTDTPERVGIVDGSNVTPQGSVMAQGARPGDAQGESVDDGSPSLSLRDTLLGQDATWGVFGDEFGVIAISSAGDMIRLYDEPFDWVRIDYQLGILWLDRPWPKMHEPGLFIADLRKLTLSPVQVAHLKRGFRIHRDGKISVSMDAHNSPYHVYNIEIMDDDMRISSRSKHVACNDECAVSAESLELLRDVRRRPQLPVSASRLDLSNYTVIARHATCSTCGRLVVLPETAYGLISVAFADHPGTVGWQIYDPRTDEFIADLTFQRSKNPHPEGQYANYIMVCEGGQALVVERQFVTSELRTLGPENPRSQGVCLNGGTSFILE
jgi:hypothetical protein